MKKLFLLGLLVSFYLTGCSYHVNLQDTNGYMLFSSYVRDNGAPVSSYDMDTGETMHTFLKPCPSSSAMQKIDVLESNGIMHKVRTTNTCPKN